MLYRKYSYRQSGHIQINSSHSSLEFVYTGGGGGSGSSSNSLDCNSNGIPDECDISSGASDDGNQNGVPDECELDCNQNP